MQMHKMNFTKSIAVQNKMSAEMSSLTDFGPSVDSSIGIKLSASAISENQPDNLNDSLISAEDDILNKRIDHDDPDLLYDRDEDN